MELLVNDLSLQGQFPDLASFRNAIERVMLMRQTAQQFGRDLYCHRNLVNAKVTHVLSMPQVIQMFPVDDRRALMQWLTRYGPFWEDVQTHTSNDYLECNDEVVTDTAVGEAAYCCLQGIDRHLVSFTPSSWEFSPVSVIWMPNDSSGRKIAVTNHWQVNRLRAALQAAPTRLATWKQLEKVSIARCPHLTFSKDAFVPLLSGHPFGDAAANQILVRLETLNRFKSCFDDHGHRTPEGLQLYQDHFTGDNAWFSDESETNKRDFEAKLTFQHPIVEGRTLFCTMHGKVKTSQLRIHFSSPIRADEPLFVVYVGPKLTKQ